MQWLETNRLDVLVTVLFPIAARIGVAVKRVNEWANRSS
jgi:hypothetical protein